MSFLKRLYEGITGKKKGQTSEQTVIQKSELEIICGDDEETYKALEHTMFLDPRKITTSMEDAASNAAKFEKEKNFNRARIWYDIAGGLAIYKGNIADVTKYFRRAKDISEKELNIPAEYPILKDPEKAVNKALEYYTKHLKTEEPSRSR
jgi:hypothetical protein